MPSAGFEPAIPVSERSQTDALDGAATDIGRHLLYNNKLFIFLISAYLYFLFGQIVCETKLTCVCQNVYRNVLYFA
jgi:hypothetical protein